MLDEVNPQTHYGVVLPHKYIGVTRKYIYVAIPVIALMFNYSGQFLWLKVSSLERRCMGNNGSQLKYLPTIDLIQTQPLVLCFTLLII